MSKSEVVAVTMPGVFPVGGRRLVVYVVWDRRGGVEDYVPFALAGLREHAARVLVVVNGSLSAEGRRKLEPVSDEILLRENVGFDIWAHKDALDHVGPGIADFDEVLLTNDTWFGPVRPYGPVFERMGGRAAHFWGMTDHAREVPNPFTGNGVLPYHLQSFWIAVRRDMFLSEAWAQYWRDLPEMPGYFDAVLQHETIFTEHFATRGYVHDVAYPSADYPTDHPALFNPDLLLGDGCPILKRRPFFHYAPFLDRFAVIGRQILEAVEAYGYPMELIWQDLARNVPPRMLNADAGMLEVLPDVDVSYDPTRPFRIVVIAHIGPGDDPDEMFRRIDLIPKPFDLVVTCRAGTEPDVLAALESAPEDVRTSAQVRPTAAEAGRDMSAFFVECRDVLQGGRYDIAVKVHSRTPSGRPREIKRYFRRYQFENLLGSAAYVRNLLALFQREPGLGAVFPPTIHIGFATPGGAWHPYRERAVKVCEEVGIEVPLDGASPVAPLGGMFVVRPEALKVLVNREWEYSDYTDSPRQREGELAHVQERLLASAVGELGYHCRTVLSADHAALSHVALEYKLDQLASTTPGYPLEQIQFLHKAGFIGRGGIADFARMHLRMNNPRGLRLTVALLRPVARTVRFGKRSARAVAARVRGAGAA